MSKTFNMYCDESTHLPNDGMPYMIIAYISSAYNQLKQHKAHIKMLRKSHKIKGEIKWSNVSGAQYPFYAALIDYFFSTEFILYLMVFLTFFYSYYFPIDFAFK